MNVKKARIFVSYSQGGEGPRWKGMLLDALAVFERHHLLDVWQDGRIRLSAYWEDDINQAMSAAQLAVVLLTPQALESPFILEKEFPYLQDRQQRDKLPVFPVVCESCSWKAYPWLRATQSPNKSKPLSELTPDAQERVFRQLATDIAEELSRVALAMLPKSDQPPAPEHVYLDKFPLTRGPGLREEKLIGREQELALLDLAFAQPGTAIVSLVAWGGVGKTMLVQHWLQRLQREGWFGARKVYAWSFYSQGTKEDRQASEDMFLAQALEWFGVQCEPTLSPWDKGRLLADAVTSQRALLILDGIEPLQYPPGPMGGQLRAPGVQSLLKQLARKANSKSGDQTSESNRGLCLVTTREPLTDLADFQRRGGSAWGSVLRVDLGNLTQEAGAALLHHAGANKAGAAEITPGDKELLAASREVDGHALTLNLLGRFLARAHGGDIRRRDLVKFEEADRKVQGGTTFKMLAAFENWFANEGDIEARALTILRLLGLFDRPADAGCMAALRTPPVIADLTESLFTFKRDTGTGQTTEYPLSGKAWNDATHFLSDFGLAVVQTGDDSSEQSLDCHPLIREHFTMRLLGSNPREWRIAHRRLYEYLKDGHPQMPLWFGGKDARQRRPTLEQMQPLYHALYHGCLAGQYADALIDILQERIQHGDFDFAVKYLGAVGQELTALSHCFAHLWDQPHESLTKVARGWILHQAGRLSMLGRLEEAIKSLRSSLDLSITAHDWPNVSTCAHTLSQAYASIGNLDAAIDLATLGVQCAHDMSDPLHIEKRTADLAGVLCLAGRDNEALKFFYDAERLHVASQPHLPLLYSIHGFRYCDLLLGTVEALAWRTFIRNRKNQIASDLRKRGRDACLTRCAEVSQRASQTLGWSESEAGILTIALDRLTLMRCEIYRCILQNPHSDIRDSVVEMDAALTSIQNAGDAWYLPIGFFPRAWLRLLKGDTRGACSDLDEAWDIAERGPMRPHMADIHLYRARLFFREKEYPWRQDKNLNGEFVTNRTAADDLAAAERLINECGYHRRDQDSPTPSVRFFPISDCGHLFMLT